MEEDIDARCGDHLLQEVGAELQIVGAAVGAWIVVFDEAVLAEGGDEAGEGGGGLKWWLNQLGFSC